MEEEVLEDLICPRCGHSADVEDYIKSKKCIACGKWLGKGSFIQRSNFWYMDEIDGRIVCKKKE